MSVQKLLFVGRPSLLLSATCLAYKVGLKLQSFMIFEEITACSAVLFSRYSSSYGSHAIMSSMSVYFCMFFVFALLREKRKKQFP